MSQKIAFVTCQALADGTDDDRVVAAALRDRGHQPQFVAWDDPNADWTSFDSIVLRSCWDYHLHPNRFLDWLDSLSDLQGRLWNPASVVRWNLDKIYFNDLVARNVPTVPTIYLEQGGEADLGALREALNADELVVKPRVSASAEGTWRTTGEADPEAKLCQALAEDNLLVQPMIREVAERGEWSLIFIDGTFSHAVLKQAKAGEFRVQSEWGGSATLGTPPLQLIELADRTLAALGHDLLYARIDSVDAGESGLIMELELFEPELFFRLASESIPRFCDALETRSP